MFLFKGDQKDILPEIYIIDENHKGFLYPNDLKTYFISQSGFLLQTEKKENYSWKNGGNTDSGLFFCEKKLLLKIMKKKNVL